MARRAQISKGYLSQLESSTSGPRPSADVLSRIAFALETTIDALLEKQPPRVEKDWAILPDELRNLACTEQIADEDIKSLAQITYQGRRPQTLDDWKFLYEAVKRSVR